jgi:ankyrin repeat protein
VVEWFYNNYENVDQLMCVTNKRGSNCLHVASQKGHLELVKYLVACGCPVNAQNNSGNTPFHMASENGHIATATWLSENGAELWV